MWSDLLFLRKFLSGVGLANDPSPDITVIEDLPLRFFQYLWGAVWWLFEQLMNFLPGCNAFPSHMRQFYDYEILPIAIITGRFLSLIMHVDLVVNAALCCISMSVLAMFIRASIFTYHQFWGAN